MKNYFIALCILLLAGCTEADVESISYQKINSQKFRAGFAEEDTRTFVDEKVRLLWTEGDLLTIFNNSTLNRKYEFDGETGDNSGTFTEIPTQQYGTGNNISTNYAVYPYASSNKISNDEVIKLSLPATQKYAEDSFGQDANTMVAVTSGVDDLFLPFKNIGGFLRLQLYGKDVTVKSIELRGNNEEKIAGKATVIAKYGKNPELEMSDSATESIMLDCGDGVALGATAAEAKDFWIVVPPTTFTKGFTITITDTEGGTMEKSTSKSYIVERNVLKSMTAFEVETELITPPDNEIWYTTTDGQIISLNNAQTDWNYPETEFGAKVISNTYVNGKGVIKFDVELSKIGSWAFWRCENLHKMYLPSKIKSIGDYAFNNCVNLQILYLSNDISSAGSYIFDNCLNLQSFESVLASDDKKTLIVNSTIVGFAPYGITEYKTPIGVKNIGDGAFCNAYILKKIIISEGVENIGSEAFLAQDPNRNGFSSQYNLEATIEEVYLPSTLKTMHPYAFLFQNKIKGIYGNNEFVSADNKFIWQYDYWGRKVLCTFTSGANIREYSIPEGIQVVENYVFYNSQIESVEFPSTLCQCPSGYVFELCHNLKSFSGKYATKDGKALCKDGTINVLACAGITEYTTPDEITAIGDGAFVNKDNLESITLSDNVKHIYGSNNFGYCDNLRTVTLSAGLLDLGSHTFYPAPKLEAVYCRAINPPGYRPPMSGEGVISEYFDFDFYVPNESLDRYKSSMKYLAFTNIKGYDFDNLPQIDYYYSTDYSADGDVTTLQTATKGNGIDIVLMGDAYSDRQIADGTYREDMENLYNNLFTEEPYKSFKDHFNVYYVNVVSATEGYEYGNTALDGYFGDGTLVGGNDNAVFNYALNAISEEEMDEALLIVAMNSDNYAGTCYMYYPDNSAGYGNGVSVSYFPKGGDATTFAQLLHHEACGHGFAKLADEYAYEGMGTVPSDYVSEIKSQQTNWGWWKNVDFTSNPTATRWSHFINDTRYANDGLGAYEGGLTYWTGVWRPTENSIMRYNTGGFNAPSREAIYYRIHKLAYGDSWEYDYEDFVEWDARNRKAAAATRGIPYKPATYKPTHPPVVVNKSWKDTK